MGTTSRRRFLLGAGAAGAALGLGAAEVAIQVHGGQHADADVDAAGAAFPKVHEEPARFGMNRVIWSVPTTRPLAALTFDDGPTPEYTPRVLEALRDAGVTATFNVMGYNAATHRSLLHEVVAAGHELGNHTWSHETLTRLTPAETREQIVRCTETVEDIVGQPLAGFRPPRGMLTGYALRVCAELGHDVWVWSCSRGPDGVGTPGAVVDHLVSTVSAGDVIDLHDGIGRGTFDRGASFSIELADRREVEVRALPEVLERVAERGITLTSAGHLLANAGVEDDGFPTAQLASARGGA